MNSIQTTKLVLTCILLAGCSSGLDQRYLDASLGGNLVLPPDLTEHQEADSTFELPAGISGEDARIRDQIPVLAKVDSLRLEGSADFYWLSADLPVDILYQYVKNFWLAEGYQLELDEPVIGVMQTGWIYRELGGKKESDSWLGRLFSSEDLSATQDQFKTRIERAGQGVSRVYIAHRGTEYQHIISNNVRSDRNPLANPEVKTNDWQFRQSEPELEIEMLSRLMIYLGLNRGQVESQLASAKLFAPRASLHIDSDEQTPFLVLKDAYPIAWNRVYHHLERLNFEILSSQFETDFSGEGLIRVNTLVAGLAPGNSSEALQAKQVVLVLSEESHQLTRVEIENAEGELDTSDAGNKFLNLLFRQVK